jgi:hypothetical protein
MISMDAVGADNVLSRGMYREHLIFFSLLRSLFLYSILSEN